MACCRYYELVFLTSLLVVVGTQRISDHGINDFLTCQPLGSSIPMCSGVGYPNATFPNHRNQTKMSEASSEIQHFLPLIKTDCSNALVHLLCAVYAPYCDVSHPLRAPIPPCVPFCEYVRSGCEDVLMNQFNISWPSQLHCEQYTLSNRATLCFGPTDIEILRSIKPPSNVGTKDMVDPPPDFNIATDICQLNSLTFAWRTPDYIPEGHLVDYQYSCEPQPPKFPKLFTDVHVPANRTITDKLDGFNLRTNYVCTVSMNSSNGTSGYAAMKTIRTLDEPALIHFVNGTPTVKQDTIYAEFVTDQAVDQVSCTLLPRGTAQPRSCINGSVTYSGLQPGQYFVRLIAKIGTCATDRLRRKAEVPCRITKSSYRINRRYVIVKFTGVGIGGAPLTEFTCSVNGETAQHCTSPLRLRHAQLAADTVHRLDILPSDEDCLKISNEPHPVEFIVQTNNA